MRGYIYLVRCKVNRKVYIGLTRRTIEERWYDHTYDSRNGGTSLLNREIRKYGSHCFSVKHLRTCSSLKQLSKAEKAYIRRYRARHPSYGYNVMDGGGSTAVWKRRKPRISKWVWFWVLVILSLIILTATK